MYVVPSLPSFDLAFEMTSLPTPRDERSKADGARVESTVESSQGHKRALYRPLYSCANKILIRA